MPIIIGLIYAALEDMGYRPMWNKSETGIIFNFMMERAVCRMDQDTLVVTFVVPNFILLSMMGTMQSSIRSMHSVFELLAEYPFRLTHEVNYN